MIFFLNIQRFKSISNKIVKTDEGQFQEENLEEIIEYDETIS